MLVKNTLSANQIQIPIFNNFLKKPMKFTGIIPDTLLETQLNSHNQWRKAMADILFASKQQLATWNNLQNILPIDMLSESYSIVRKGLTNYFFWAIITAGNTSSNIQAVSEKRYSETLIMLKL